MECIYFVTLISVLLWSSLHCATGIRLAISESRLRPVVKKGDQIKLVSFVMESNSLDTVIYFERILQGQQTIKKSCQIQQHDLNCAPSQNYCCYSTKRTFWDRGAHIYIHYYIVYLIIYKADTQHAGQWQSTSWRNVVSNNITITVLWMNLSIISQPTVVKKGDRVVLRCQVNIAGSCNTRVYFKHQRNTICPVHLIGSTCSSVNNIQPQNYYCSCGTQTDRSDYSVNLYHLVIYRANIQDAGQWQCTSPYTIESNNLTIAVFFYANKGDKSSVH
ncbi:uncharacterized protein LOC121385905 [Gigantopelta aegis]|uniref:uncharacterized protein LOC121385905 n=1 Tax=Gigantopelta aegis TaxID=1735272 RepID=UPI001B889DD6|nr:uncharacterized protein LOC121385905 [Gigantopelta aegis]